MSRQATRTHGVRAPADRGSATGGHGPGTSRVLVLNATYEPINVCTVRRAAVLVLKSKAEVVERGNGKLRSERMALERPVVIRLITYVRVPRDVHRRKITRKAVLARDSWTCQYCGGKSAWDNIVASCAACNRRKGNRLPREAEMHPRHRPKPPGPTVFIQIASPRIPAVWEPYLITNGATATV